MINNLASKAVLIKVKTSSYSGRIQDKKVTKEVQTDKKATNESGKYIKYLLSGKDMLKAITKVQNKARAVVYQYGLPWTNDNFYIVPNPLVQKTFDEVNDVINEHNDAVQNFLDEYDALKLEDQNRLGDMYDAGAYPSKDDLRSMFKMEVITHPVPTAEDFRCSLSAQQMAEIKQELEKEVMEVQADAMEKVWERVTDTVVRLRDSMRKFDKGEQKSFHDTVINNIVDVIDILPALNLSDDEKLNDMAEEIKDQLLKFEPQDLRTSQEARQEAADNADAILKKVNGYI